jgi:hypothetical protein
MPWDAVMPRDGVGVWLIALGASDVRTFLVMAISQGGRQWSG